MRRSRPVLPGPAFLLRGARTAVGQQSSRPVPAGDPPCTTSWPAGHRLTDWKQSRLRAATAVLETVPLHVVGIEGRLAMQHHRRPRPSCGPGDGPDVGPHLAHTTGGVHESCQLARPVPSRHGGPQRSSGAHRPHRSIDRHRCASGLPHPDRHRRPGRRSEHPGAATSAGRRPGPGRSHPVARPAVPRWAGISWPTSVGRDCLTAASAGFCPASSVLTGRSATSGP